MGVWAFVIGLSQIASFFSADKASNNYTFVCKKHYVNILIEELGLNSLSWNPTYNLTDFLHQKCWTNRSSLPLGIQKNNEELDLPYIYWIPKVHKNPYKHIFIAISSKCSTKPLSILLTKLLIHISKVFRSTAKKVGSIRRGSSRIRVFITPSLLALACFGTFWTSLFNLLNYFVWLRITDEGSVPEMRILLI